MPPPPLEPVTLTCPKCGHSQELAATLVDHERAQIEREIGTRLKAALETQLRHERDRMMGEAEHHYARQLSDALKQIEDGDAQIREIARQKQEIEAQVRRQVSEEVRSVTGQQQHECNLLREQLKARDARLTLAEEEQIAFRRERESLALERRSLGERIAQERAQAAGDTEARLRLEGEALERAKEREIQLLRIQMQEAEQAQELRIRQQLAHERLTIESQVRREVDATYRTNLQAKDVELSRLSSQIQDLQRPRNITTIGKAQEQVLEEVLRRAFPRDRIERIATGQPGGDIVQGVAAGSQECGAILWESKNTQHWNKEWTGKNREDQQRVSAQIGVIVTAALPPGVESFTDIDSVWVAGLAHVEPLARILRQQLIEVARVRMALDGHETKIGRTYAYLTSQEFRQRVMVILESYEEMRSDLDSEKRSLKKLWAKREKQLLRAIDSAGAMWGDLEGIVGAQMPQISYLALPGQTEEPAAPLVLRAGA